MSKKNNIHILQNEFLSAIFQDDTQFISRLNSSHNLSAELSIKIYSGSVLGNLIKALGEIFPVCKSLVGVLFFEKMAEKFIKLNPPTNDRLDDYGGDFHLFIEDFEPVKSLPYLKDMAKLEWQVHLIFHEKDVSLDRNMTLLKKMENNKVDSLAVNLTNISALAILSLDYPVQEILAMHWLNDWQEVSMNAFHTRLLVWRNGVNIYTQPLTDESYDWHCRLMKKKPLWLLQEEFENFNHLLVKSLEQGSILLQ